MLFSCFYKSFYIFQGFSFGLNATASKGKEILHVLLLKLRQGLHEKIPHARSPAWAPIDGKEGKSTPAKETSRCFIHGHINKSILINNEIHSLPPAPPPPLSWSPDCIFQGSVGLKSKGIWLLVQMGMRAHPKTAAAQARSAPDQPVPRTGIQPWPRHP